MATPTTFIIYKDICTDDYHVDILTSSEVVMGYEGFEVLHICNDEPVTTSTLLTKEGVENFGLHVSPEVDATQIGKFVLAVMEANIHFFTSEE